MRIRSLTIILFIVALMLVLFLAINRVIISLHIYGVDENFFGMSFGNYRYSISRFSVYLPHLFVIFFVVGLFLKNRSVMKYALLITALVGFILAWKAYDYFAPW